MNARARAFAVAKNPIRARSSLAAAVLVFLASFGAAAETLTEADVIRLVKTGYTPTLVASAAATVAEAEAIGAGLHPNPSVGWQRDHVTGAQTRDRSDSIFVTVPIELGGRRATDKALARVSAAHARAEAARARSEATRALLQLFYEAIAAERELAILGRLAAELDAAAKIMARRHEEGTASGYDRARLELDTELARSEVEQARGTARALRATLAALLALPAETLALQGDLTTQEPEQRQRGPAPRALEELRSAEAAAAEAPSAAGLAWFPALSLTGGYSISAEETETRTGYVAGVSLSLPIFSRGQGARAEARARRELARAEVQAEERALRASEARAREELVTARREIARFGAAARRRLELLERAVQSGYREGDRSLLERVEAERVRADVERRLLELELAAKLSELELRAARGEFQ